MKKVEIYKVEYVISTRPDENWVAYVAGFNSRSVQEYIGNYVKNGKVIINSMTTMSRLDAITNEVREFIARPLLGVKEEKANEPQGERVDDSKPVKRSVVPKG